MDLLIEKIKAHVPVSPADEIIIRRLFNKKIIPKDEHLLEPGQVCRHLTFIEQGLVRYYSFTNGEEQTNYFNKEGEWVCDYPSFIPQTPTTVYIQALETTTIYTISYNELQTFYKEVKYGERFGRLSIEQVFNNIIQQVI
jgi:CRP-like cAMP-binding protein